MAASFFAGRAARRGAHLCELRRHLSVAGISPTIARRKKTPLEAGLSVACLCGGASSRCYPVRAVSGELLLFRTRHFFGLLPWLACFPKVRLRRCYLDMSNTRARKPGH